MKDLELLEWLRLGNDNDNDNIPTLEHGIDYINTLIVMMRHMIQLIPIMMIISNTCKIHTNYLTSCNTMLFCNYVLFILLVVLINF